MGISPLSSTPSSTQALSALPADKAGETPSKESRPSSTPAQAQASADPGGEGTREASSEPSSLKSFTYGALDLDKPSESEESKDAYTAGKWVGAAAKVGGIVSLLI
nr:hypothetical protein [uncultured Holophaga sp.]